MDKFEKAILTIVVVVLVVSVSYVIWVLNGVMNGYYIYSFPFIIYVPITAAICIPLIVAAKKRQEERMKEDRFSKNLEN